MIAVGGLALPPNGLTISLTIETYHVDPDQGDSPGNRIVVLRESKRLGDSPSLARTAGTAVFEVEFGETVMSGTDRVTTPTDYYGYDIQIFDERLSASEPIHTLGQEIAFLMEDQVSVPVNPGQVGRDGGLPQELVVYYCDMFVFQKDDRDPESRLHRREIPEYVEKELVPGMLEAVRTQTEEWRFPWQRAWTSYRVEDGRARLSVALSAGETWFHGQAPMRGHSGISIRTDGRANREYETLTDGLLSTFHHELFHTLQKGVVQELAGHADADGQKRAWGFLTEGTAVLVESVAQPATQFKSGSGPRTYMSHANGFIGRSSYHGELNSSYARMTPYRAALFWRFLYEQCGGMENGTEHPRTGMRLIRQILEALYSKTVTDMSQSMGLTQVLPAIVDQVLNGPEAPLCPFETFRESLRHFARAIYQLRLDGGRCTEPDVPAGCGLYDPNHLYVDPPVSTVTYRGEQMVFAAPDQGYPSGIKSSFGIDFVDIELDPSAQGQSLTIEFYGAPEGSAEFGVEIWRLVDPEALGGSSKRPAAVGPPEQLVGTTAEGHLLYAIPEIDTGRVNRLGLIITRLDSEEKLDPVGEYTIVLRSRNDL
jgi:hypothetical protein